MNLTQAEALYARYSDAIKRQEHEGLVLFDYYYADYKMFTEAPETREFRGIIFDVATGRVASRPFHKFFNVNEKEETQEEKLIFHGHAAVKQDGSMAQLTSHNGRLIVASRSSLTGYVNKEVLKYLETAPEIKEFVLNHPNHTFLFEYLDPEAPIVLRPNAKELVFLEARDKHTGMYEFAKFHAIVPTRVTPTKEITPQSWAEYYKPYLENVEGEEGFVLHLDGQDMYKVKTAWYVNSHNLVTGQSPKGFITLWSEGKLDDAISSLVMLGHQGVADEANAIVSRVRELLDSRLTRLLSSGVTQEMTVKEVAITLRELISSPVDNLLFAALMSAHRAGQFDNRGGILNDVRVGLKESSGRIRSILDALGVKEEA